MLRDAQLFANLKVPSLDRAIEFYTGNLGLELAWDGDVMPGHREALFSAGGGIICLEQGEVAQSQGTPASFAVEDVEGTVAALRERGVTFEDYDLPSVKTEDGIATVGKLKAAWFKDPGGNLLAVISNVDAMKS